MTKNNHKEFIDRKYITSFVLRFSFLVFVCFVFIGCVLFFFFNKDMGTNYLSDIKILSHMADILPWVLLSTGVFQALLFSLIFLVLALVWSHSIAGPLVRLEKSLQMLQDGQYLDQVHFRENDQLKSLAAQLTKLHHSSNESHQKLSQYLDKAESILKSSAYEELNKKQKEELIQLYYAIISLSKEAS